MKNAANPALADAVCELAFDPDRQVRLQVIETLAACPTRRAVEVLAALMTEPGADVWQRGAVLASLTPQQTPAVLQALLHPSAGTEATPPHPANLAPIVQTALAQGGPAAVQPLLRELARDDAFSQSVWQPFTLAALMEAARRDSGLAAELEQEDAQRVLRARLEMAHDPKFGECRAAILEFLYKKQLKHAA